MGNFGLPLGDGLACDKQSLSYVLLGQPLLFPQPLQIFTQRHTHHLSFSVPEGRKTVKQFLCNLRLQALGPKGYTRMM